MSVPKAGTPLPLRLPTRVGEPDVSSSDERARKAAALRAAPRQERIGTVEMDPELARHLVKELENIRITSAPSPDSFVRRQRGDRRGW